MLHPHISCHAFAHSEMASTTVCVVNIPDTLTVREFRFIFKFANGIERAIVNVTKQGHQVGYARFSTVADAQQAVEFLNGYPLDEDFPNPIKAFLSTTQLNDHSFAGPRGVKRPLDGEQAVAKVPRIDGKGKGKGKGAGKGKGMAKGGAPAAASTTSVYVGGVPHDWDETMLQGLFETCGAITSINLTGGKNPVGNIAFVHFSTSDEANYAIQSMNGYAVDESRYLSVRPNTSAPKPTAQW